MSRPETASQGQRVAPDGGNSAAGVMLDHCGGLVHLLWLGGGGEVKYLIQAFIQAEKYDCQALPLAERCR